MVRYCINCKKDIDFPIKSIKDLDSLVCPVCGNPVGKNNRNPEIVNNDDKIEQGIGNAVGVFLGFCICFIFFLPFLQCFFITFRLQKRCMCARLLTLFSIYYS